VKLFNDVTARLQKYYLERNIEALQEIVILVRGEIADPEVQEATITVADSLEAVEKDINSQGFLRITLDDFVDSTGPVIEGQLIRVFSKGQEAADGCMVLNVAHLDEIQIILVPSGGPA
jgi:hypothetical protein